MSTSLLYHCFGVVGYRYVSQNFEAGMTTFRVEQPVNQNSTVHVIRLRHICREAPIQDHSQDSRLSLNHFQQPSHRLKLSLANLH